MSEMCTWNFFRPLQCWKRYSIWLYGNEFNFCQFSGVLKNIRFMGEVETETTELWTSRRRVHNGSLCRSWDYKQYSNGEFTHANILMATLYTIHTDLNVHSVQATISNSILNKSTQFSLQCVVKIKGFTYMRN